jgi:hypothetical protein
MENDYDNNDFEDWEGDYLLIQEEDWAGLVKLRKQKAEKYLNDLYSQWRYGEALVFNQEFKQALEFLTPIYKREPDYPDVIHSIIDALYGLGKTENDFDWMEKPDVLKLDDETKTLCKDFLQKKRKPISLLSLFEWLLMNSDYMTFNREELYAYLMTDGLFKFSGDEEEFWDVEVSLKKK